MVLSPRKVNVQESREGSPPRPPPSYAYSGLFSSFNLVLYILETLYTILAFNIHISYIFKSKNWLCPTLHIASVARWRR